MPTIKLPGGFEFQDVPKGAIALAVVLITLLAGFGYFIWQPQQKQELISVQAANEALRRDMTEYSRHLGDLPDVPAVTVLDDARGRITVSHYRDGCLMAAAYSSDGALIGSKLILDMAKDPDRKRALEDLFFPTAQAAQLPNICDRVAHGAVMKQGEDGREGCVIFIHRLFQDGCEHIQPFDACHGVWAPPRWIRCNH